MQNQTQTQQPTALTPADPLGARFCEYFSHPWNFIFAPVPAPGEPTQWQTETAYPLQPRNLFGQHQNPDTLIGLRFGEETRYLLIDIDKGSPYHPENNFSGFKDVVKAVEQIGLCRRLVIQSSWSGGIHVYYFLPPLPTFALACAVKFALEDAGLQLRQGQLETFPNVKAYSKHKPSDYNAHRLPLQVGSYLLDEDLQPLSGQLAYLLDAADIAAAHQDLTALKDALSAAKERHKLKYLPGTSSKALEWKRHLEERIAEGWTGADQTNELLKDFAIYGIVWLALTGDALVDYVEATATASPGYQEYCSHQHEIRRRAQEWARCCEGFYTPYCSYPERSSNYKKTFNQPTANNVVPFRNQINEERSAQAQSRVSQVVTHLESLGVLPAPVKARAKSIIATAKELVGIGISWATLCKESYLALWHPKYYKLGSVLQSEPLPALDSSDGSTPPPCSIEISPELKSPEPLPALDSSDGSTPPPLMKVCLKPSGGKTPQGFFHPAVAAFFLAVGGESEGGEVPVALVPTASTAPGAAVAAGEDLVAADPATAVAAGEDLVAADPATAVAAGEDLVAADPAAAVAADVVPSSPLEFRRVTKIRLAARTHAEKSARIQALSEGRKFSPIQRTQLEQLAKFRFYWESGEPILMLEATKWAIANPDALPEALPLVTPAASEDAPAAPAASEDAPAAPEVLPLEVGERVEWDNCPGHCSWANPFTITSIEGDMAWLDLYSKRVPVSCLRRALS